MDEHTDIINNAILPSPDIKRVRSSSYCGLVSPEEVVNITAVRRVRYNLVRIGPSGEGGPAPGGIVTGDPEDVRWFAQRLLELADEMESAAPI